jgi:hypothetical protein|tara:strand:- start:486 stop:665 length:180 start_codon:yes stop_codon:yes gene_type:complete
MAEEGKVQMNLGEYKKLIKKYKKTKRYMKSNLFQVKMMDGTEKFVSKLLEEADQAQDEL